MLSVLHIVPNVPGLPAAVSGPMTVLRGLIPALAAAGVHCEVATVADSDRPEYRFSIPATDTPVHTFPTTAPARLWNGYAPRLAPFLNRQLYAGRFQLVHIHEIWHYPGFAAARAARRHHIPTIISFHGDLDEWRLRYKRLKKAVYLRCVQNRAIRAAAALHALTAAEKVRIRQLGYTQPLFVCPNGADLPDAADLPGHAAAADAAAFRKRFPQLAGKPTILFMGRIHPMKGVDLLAHSFTDLARRFPDARLLIAGPDQDGAQAPMESILRAGGVRDRVIFAGTLTGPDKHAALRQSQLFVLPSYSEGFSTAVVEAMAAGLPVVISEQCNFPEAAQHSAGLVVPTDSAALTSAVSGLLADPALRCQMANNARALIAAHYSWPAIAAAMRRHYGDILERRRVQPRP